MMSVKNSGKVRFQVCMFWLGLYFFPLVSPYFVITRFSPDISLADNKSLECLPHKI